MNAPAKTNVTVGQPIVLITHARGWNASDHASFGHTVSRVSRTGKFEVVADSTGTVRYFQAQGYEVEGNMNGKVKSYGYTASTDVESWKKREEQTHLRRVAADALNNVTLENRVLHTYSKEAMVEKLAELEALVQAARVAVEALD